MVDGGAAGDVQAVRLGRPDGLDAGGGGDHGNVQAPSAVAQDVEVPPDAEGLGFLRQTGQSHAGAGRALVHQSVGLKVGVVGLGEDRGAERSVVLEGAAQELGPADRRIVAEGLRTGGDQGVRFRQVGAVPTSAQGRHGNHACHLSLAAEQDGLDVGRLVAARACGGHGRHARKAALCSHSQALLEAFGPVCTRVAEVGLQVPPAGKSHSIAEVAVTAVSIQRTVRRFDAGETVMVDQQVHRTAVERVSWEDQRGGAVSGHGRGFG